MSWLPQKRLAFILAASAALVVSGAAGAGTQTAKGAVTATFTTPGTYVWTVPTGVTAVTFDVFGARGGSVLSSSGGIVNVVSSGGVGGEAKGRFAVHGGEKFEIVVGGAGGATTLGHSSGAGGFNGGGAGSPSGAGGGGGSDVRLGGRGNGCVGSKTCGYGDRIVVAGGGGGGSDSAGANGDFGGGLTGGGTPCTVGNLRSGESGGQECVGTSNVLNCGQASFGGFGTGGEACSADSWGAGGGGWFGGGSFTNAGGGSGYVSAFSKSGSFPGGTQQGDGKVIITTG